MVIFRPGTLTRNYVYGKRARYISPLALFLFTVFFMFAVFAFAGSGPPVNINESGSVAEAQEDLAEVRAELVEAEADLQSVIANPDPDQPAGLEISLARQAVGLAQAAVAREEAALRRAQAREAEAAAAPESEAAPAVVAPVHVGEGEAPAIEIQAPVADGEAAPEQPAINVSQEGVSVDRNDDDLTWQEAARELGESNDFVLIQGWDSLNEKAREKLRNPELAVYKIQQTAYKFSFLLIPISLPFIALLFLWKRGVTLYDHVVFALYSLSFASILFVSMVLAAQVSWLVWFVPTSLMIGIPVHTFFHLKGAYALGWFSALWRTFFMLIFASIALSFFLIAIVILGLTG
jgi:hypothetical protein